MDTTLSDPLVGRLLDGRYYVESRLARGGMATVYRAMDIRLSRTVALKVMHQHLAQDQEFVSRFIREARSAAQLSHANVVAVFDQGADEGNVYLAMEYVEGRTLRQALRERGRLTLQESLDVLKPVLSALGAAHAASLVHRDVKPENVLLSDDGRVKVADFGLARTASSVADTSENGVLIGTVAYIAPEQVQRGAADARTDVYAAGVMLFEMLTGRQPFSGDSPVAVAYRHVDEDLPPPSSFAPRVPPAVDALVALATNRDPDLRLGDGLYFLAAVYQAERVLGQQDRQPATDAAPEPYGQTLVVPRETRNEAGPFAPAYSRAAPDADGEPPGYQPVPALGRRPARGAVGLITVLLVAALVALMAWYVGSGPGAYVQAPSLLGLDKATAEQRALARGFSVRYGPPEFSESLPADHVTTTVPGPRGGIKKNGTVTITLSKGPERYAVPNLVGKPLAEAQTILAETRLIAGDVTEIFDDRVKPGQVVQTEPAGGTQVRREVSVNLTVSKGTSPIEVPVVVGQQVGEARKIIERAKLQVVVETSSEESGKPAGVVIGQEPPAGQLAKGDTVKLLVSSGSSGKQVTVPDVIGEDVDDAEEILEDAGLEVVVNRPFRGNTILTQTPRAGSQVPRGTTVTLVAIL